jgi:polyisoprenoid-binding protein YceI
MTTWTFEPGHTAAEFRARHMMVTWVRGHFKNVTGTMDFMPDDPSHSSIKAVIDANQLWTGESARDAHLKSVDFLDVTNYPLILFKSTFVEQCGANDYKAAGDLTIRGISRPVVLDVQYLGQWPTPYWQNGVDKGPITRAGFVARTSINRYDFDVKWNSSIDRAGIVVSKEIDITIDVEALRDSDFKK